MSVRTDLVGLLRRRAQTQGDQVIYSFLIDGESRAASLTCGELDRRARAMGRLLQDQGLAGQRVLLVYPPGLDYVAAFFGCLYAGAVAVPVYPPRPNRPMPRLLAVQASAAARVALTSADVLARCERHLPPEEELRWLVTDDVDAGLGDCWRDDGPGDLAFLQYTSGSTAAPKGVMLTHANLLANLELIRRTFALTPEDRGVFWLPPYHDMGLIGGILSPLYVGFPTTLMAPVAFLQKPVRWLGAISRERATVSGAPNFAYDLCVDKVAEAERDELDLTSWQVAFNGAEPVRADTLERFAAYFGPRGFRRKAHFPCYGLAEGTLLVTGAARGCGARYRGFDAVELERHRVSAAAPGAPARTLVSCGAGPESQEVRVVRPEQATPCAPGEVGEIWVRGPSVARGYWALEEETARAFAARLADGEGPYLRTGDLGFVDGGELFVTGRSKDLVILRGRNHYPQDLEATAAASHPALAADGAAAFAVEVDGEERLVIVQEVRREERRADPRPMLDAIRRAVADEHEVALHAAVLIRPMSLPKTSSGKVQRGACRDAFLAGTLQTLAEWQPAADEAELPETETLAAPAELAAWLVREIARRAGVASSEVDPQAPISAHALDSLRAMELMQAIEERCGATVPMESFFEDVSPAELARRLLGEASAAAPPPAAAEPVGEHPLSHGQLSLWFLHLLDPTSPAYNVASAVRVRGPLDAEALRRSFQYLADRHAVLRTTFEPGPLGGGRGGIHSGPLGGDRGGIHSGDEPRQRVHERLTVPFEAVAAGGWDDDVLVARLRDEANRPFDLTAGPLLRVKLYARAADDHALLVAMHHAVTDFWSLGVLLDELGAVYPALAAGREPELAPPALCYADFARWQRRRLAGPEGERLRAYWTQRLAGELPATELRTDRPRPRARASAGAVHRFQLDRGLSERLEAFGRGRRATPFMTLAAVFEVLLARHTGQRELLLGTVSAARTHGWLGRMPGYFVNPLVLRADLAGRPGFGEVLARVRRDVLGAFEHQDYPFATLVEQLRPERDPGRSPLFDALFVLQEAALADGQDLTGFALGEPRTGVEVGGLRLVPVPFEQGLAQFDLTLSMGKIDGAYVATFDYDPQLFDAVTVEHLAGRFVRLAAGLVDDPRLDVALVGLLTAAEERQLLETWNATAFAYPGNATVADLFEARAARTPEAPAVFAGAERLTYGELDRRANQAARHLQARGVGPETLVAICLERSTDLMAAIFGVLKAGGAYLPLDPAHPRERLAATARAAGAALVVTREPYRALFTTDALALDAAALAALPTERPARAATARSLAAVIFTSGSTGEPKGVALEHRPLVNMIASFLDSYRPGADDRILPLTSIANASFVGEILPLLAAGGALVLPEEHEVLDLDALFALLERRAVTIVSTVPAVSANLNALGARLPKLRLLLVGGEALAAGDVHKLVERVEVVNGYGLTETAICSTVYRLGPADFAAGARLAIGKPVANTRVYVLDRRGRPAPAGVAGELLVGGDGLARGYLGDPAKTAARFVPDPFGAGGRLFRTGDLAAWRHDGNLEFLGRRDRQVSLRGFRIELGEVESALTLVPGVRAAAVTVREDVPGQPRLVAYAVPEDEGDAGAILGALREQLPGYMVPSALVFLAALPLRPSGKVDVERLPPPPARKAAAAALPRSALERAIADVWRRELGVDEVGLDDNFFDLGGHSLLMTKVHQRLKEALGRELSLIELFQYPSVGALARHLAGGESAEAPRRSRRRPADAAGGVAVIGLAGRFPGAGSPEELWRNLEAGVESIHVFSDEELLAAGVAPELVNHPDYVKAKGILGDVDLFDAGFFGLNPREVELMDPQHRLFLECAWEALEDAGYDPERYDGLVGVYGGESMNTYLLTNLLSHLELVASADTLQASLGNDKDPLTSRVAYKLDLRGPSVTVQTASSTSLAAVHVAVRSLLVGDCDMALAGGVSIHLPEATGYFYQEGGTTSKDGHTRAFDARSTGFVSGHGAGVVVLKRLADAVADGDHVYAVIKGSACNNDGTAKVSFMAPSVDGQVAVYRQAYEDAGVPPETVSYVECHGTGTALGDPIEITALSRVFGAATAERGFCAIGSLKTNIGHLDTAAGVCGLIKATLSLAHGAIPPSLHFETPNPRIDFAASPFFVNTELRPWTRRGDTPRRAGSTSLGMGGTNVHVVLEEAPEVPAPAPSRPWQLLLLSARSAGALGAVTERLAERLRRGDDLPLADVAYTLQVGRKAFEHRRMLLCRGRDDALAALEEPGRLRSAVHRPGDRPVAFLFPGQGSQYPNMGRGLYEAEPSFRDDVDRCARLLEPHLGCDLREVLFVDEAADDAAARLRQTELTQPALFTVSWATARLWMSWGVAPSAMIGHSLGEYVAACLAGVMTLEDALALVALRGRLMQRMQPGAMATVELPAAEVTPLLGDELSLAAVNRPSDCVVSGPAAAVERLLAELARRDVGCRRLHTSHAYHSRMMEPMLRPFAEAVAKVRLEPPRIPYVSNVTGTWVRPEDATDPEYWARHVRSAVRFADGLGELLAEPRRLLLEVGPGSTLASLARQHPARGDAHAVLSSLRHPKEDEGDLPFLLDALGRLWLAGGEVDWTGFYAGETRRRVPLPTYPFERRRYWVEPLPEGPASRRRGRLAIDDWFYVPAWKRLPLPDAALPEAGDWLLLVEGSGLGDALAERLRAAGHRVTTVAAGEGFGRDAEDRYRLAPGRAEDYEALFEALGRVPPKVVHLWNVTSGAAAAEVLERGFYSPLFLARTLGQRGEEVELTVVASGLHEVTGGEAVEPLKASLLGPCGVAPREYAHLRCRVIDVEPAAGGARLAEQILRETAADPAPLVAFRGRHRWVRDFEAVSLADGASPLLRPRGVYLITGGRGGLGLEIAGELAREARARLVLVGRSPVPPRAEWAAAEDEKARRLAELEALGAEVLALSADVADREAMRRVKEEAEARFGPVNGVVHAAGVPGAGLIRAKEREAAEQVLRPKVMGLAVLDELFRGDALDFFVSLSTITAVLPEPGQVDYVAANAVLDAFATAPGANGTRRASINWDAWREVGMAVDTEVPEEFRAWRRETLAEGLSSAEGVAAFRRILASGLSQVVVSTRDLAVRRAESATFRPLDELAAPAAATQTHARPADLTTPYVAPASELERRVAAVWQEILGIERIGLDDNFFELGGNSLAGIRITQRLKERHGADISDVSIYEGPTVRALAELMTEEEAPEETPAALVAAQESRSRGERRRARMQRRRGGGGES